MVKHILLVILGFVWFAPLSGMQRDSVPSHDLKEVEIRSSLPLSSFLTTAPLQTLSTDKLERMGALQVADAVKYFSGIQVKDYGGVGGLKTVSIRSLGANYTTVAYDGVTVSDYQTGQIDLGRFPVDNLSQIRLTTGNHDDIFQPARNRALGGLIQIATQTFVPSDTRRDEIKAGLRTGSWKMMNPFASYSRALGKTFVWNVSGELLNSEGNYPFQIAGEKRRRNHSEVENRKWEGNLTGKLPNGGQVGVKAYYYDSDRNIPGAAISVTDYAGENMKDRTAFVQTSYKQTLNGRWSLLSNLKYGVTALQYANSLYPDRGSRYNQREAYLSAALLYRWSEQVSISWANDGSVGNFRAIHKDKSYFPSRTTWLSALSAKYEIARLTVNGSGLFQAIGESSSGNRLAKNHWRFSPSAGLSVQPVGQWPVRLRASYRNTYRLPTFSDIYFPSLPNTNLKPENAHQYNIGALWVASVNEAFGWSFSIDAYYNQVENKIIAVPLSSLALWSVQNYGKADLRGFDVNVATHIRFSSGFSTEISGNYTRQEALNEKKQLLRYTPRHFASALATLKTPWCNLNYHLVYCGHRYYNETLSWESLVGAYADHGFSLTKDIRYKTCRLHVSAECLNLTNRLYEVVHAYPMPGRSFRMGLKFTY
ncbi:MAG: TonB-dependent receptor [Dysgonamonadaceae bacterium]|nr:TonB-dependent receptor [Dysgonamonadaceae bacterium]